MLAWSSVIATMGASTTQWVVWEGYLKRWLTDLGNMVATWSIKPMWVFFWGSFNTFSPCLAIPCKWLFTSCKRSKCSNSLRPKSLRSESRCLVSTQSLYVFSWQFAVRYNYLKKNSDAIQVKEILTEGSGESQRAVGVKLADGRVFRGKSVISNATRWDTFEKLMAQESLPPSEEAFRKRYKKSPSFLSIHMGVKASALPKGKLRKYSRLISCPWQACSIGYISTFVSKRYVYKYSQFEKLCTKFQNYLLRPFEFDLKV